MSHSLIRGAPGHLERGRVRIKLPAAAAAAAEMIHSLKFFFSTPLLVKRVQSAVQAPPPTINLLLLLLFLHDLKERDSSHIFHDDAPAVEGGDSACGAGWRARAPHG